MRATAAIYLDFARRANALDAPLRLWSLGEHAAAERVARARGGRVRIAFRAEDDAQGLVVHRILGDQIRFFGRAGSYAGPMSIDIRHRVSAAVV